MFTVDILYNGVFLHLFFQLLDKRWHIGSSKLAMMGLFIARKATNAVNQSLIHCFVDCLDLK